MTTLLMALMFMSQSELVWPPAAETKPLAVSTGGTGATGISSAGTVDLSSTNRPWRNVWLPGEDTIVACQPSTFIRDSNIGGTGTINSWEVSHNDPGVAYKLEQWLYSPQTPRKPNFLKRTWRFLIGRQPEPVL